MAKSWHHVADNAHVEWKQLASVTWLEITCLCQLIGNSLPLSADWKYSNLLVSADWKHLASVSWLEITCLCQLIGNHLSVLLTCNSFTLSADWKYLVSGSGIETVWHYQLTWNGLPKSAGWKHFARISWLKNQHISINWRKRLVLISWRQTKTDILAVLSRPETACLCQLTGNSLP